MDAVEDLFPAMITNRSMSAVQWHNWTRFRDLRRAQVLPCTCFDLHQHFPLLILEAFEID